MQPDPDWAWGIERGQCFGMEGPGKQVRGTIKKTGGERREQIRKNPVGQESGDAGGVEKGGSHRLGQKNMESKNGGESQNLFSALEGGSKTRK